MRAEHRLEILDEAVKLLAGIDISSLSTRLDPSLLASPNVMGDVDATAEGSLAIALALMEVADAIREAAQVSAR